MTSCGSRPQLQRRDHEEVEPSPLNRTRQPNGGCQKAEGRLEATRCAEADGGISKKFHAQDLNLKYMQIHHTGQFENNLLDNQPLITITRRRKEQDFL